MKQMQNLRMQSNIEVEIVIAQLWADLQECRYTLRE